jgi:hypothetical protein
MLHSSMTGCARVSNCASEDASSGLDSRRSMVVVVAASGSHAGSKVHQRERTCTPGAAGLSTVREVVKVLSITRGSVDHG